MKRHGNLQKCLCFITSDGEVTKKIKLALKRVVLLKVKCSECLPLLHHVPGGSLRKAIEMNVVTASVTWFIVHEEIRVQRHRECTHLLRRCTQGFDYPFTSSVFSLTSKILAFMTEKKIPQFLEPIKYCCISFLGLQNKSLLSRSTSSYQKLHIRRFQFLQPVINPFSRICSNSWGPVSSHKEHTTVRESS